MAFLSNDSQQISMTDRTFFLSEREKHFLEESWAQVFAQKIFPAIREEEFAVLYSGKASRPNSPVNVIVGALILKEALGMTDDQLVQAMMFDVRFQYALHTTSFKEQPLSERTLGRFRARNQAYALRTGRDLMRECLSSMEKEMSEFMAAAGERNADSMAVAANIRSLADFELLYTAVSNLACLMDVKEELPEEFSHFLDEEDYSRFLYQTRYLDASQRLLRLAGQAEDLCDACGDRYDDFSEYQLLIRLLSEQTRRDREGRLQLSHPDL